jgi:O-antigen ligase
LILLVVAVEALVVHHRAFSGGRLQGVFPQIAPDVLGTLAVVGLLAVIFSVGPQALLSLSIRLVLGTLYVAELLATETRSAIVLGAIVMILSLVPWAFASPARLAMLLFGTVLMLGSLLFVAPAVQQRLHRGESDVTFSTLNGRTTAWAEGVQAWSTSRLHGLGYYSGHRFGPVLEPGQGESTNLDNTWIESLVDVGIAGTALLGGFVLAASGRMLRSKGAVSISTYVFVASTSLIYFLTSFVNPTVAGNESINFVVWTFVLLLFPLRNERGRASGRDALAADPATVR